MRFRGTYQHSVDAKGRLSLPAKFRKALTGDVTIVPVPNEDYGKGLYVFLDEDYDEWVDSFFAKEEKGYDPSRKDHRALARFLNAAAETVTVDAAGRVKLPAAACAKVGIGKDVAVVGQGDHIEIYDAASFNAFMDEFDPFADMLK